MVSATIPDLLRLLVVPVFGWAAIRDIETRRVPNRTWLPLAALGVVLLCWEALSVWTNTAYLVTFDGLLPSIAGTGVAQSPEVFFIRTAFSVGFVVAFAYGFWWFGGFGGADAKALMTLAVVFPTYPQFLFDGFTLPWIETVVGVFSLTILSNTVLAGAGYPFALALRNLVGGHLSVLMFIGRPVPVGSLPERYGGLLERPDGYTRRGMDLDVLRMYLTWRDCSVSDIRADPEGHRDPASIPEDPNPAGDGTITDGGTEQVDADGEVLEGEETDPWGAAAFFEDIGGPIYGTDAADLRGGLELVSTREALWYSPGIPFIVPMFVGLLLSLTAGDVLVWLLGFVGVA